MAISLGKGWSSMQARYRNILDFYAYYSHEYRANGYYVKNLKPLRISALHIPRVGWVPVK